MHILLVFQQMRNDIIYQLPCSTANMYYTTQWIIQYNRYTWCDRKYVDDSGLKIQRWRTQL